MLRTSFQNLAVLLLLRGPHSNTNFKADLLEEVHGIYALVFSNLHGKYSKSYMYMSILRFPQMNESIVTSLRCRGPNLSIP